MERKYEHARCAAHRPWLRSSSCPDVDCVEVRFLSDAVLMRDSKVQHEQLRFSFADWGDFLHRLRTEPNCLTAVGTGTRIGTTGLHTAGSQTVDGALASAAAEGGG
ncbi:MAG TPA: DUF397 domain-containing protein [Actinocrinis sp.]|nr:DUF397 domain-containing protein [Actinocrinis sp.]